MKLEFRAPGVARSLRVLLERIAPPGASGWCDIVASEAAIEVDGTAVRHLAVAVEPGCRVSLLGDDALLTPALPTLPPDPDDRPWSSLVVLAPAPPWWSGVMTGSGRKSARKKQGGGDGGGARSAFEVAFERIAQRGSLAALWLRPSRPSLRRTLDRLAQAGFPVLGDVRMGGIVSDAGFAAAGVHDDAALHPDGLAERVVWPEEPVFAGGTGGEPATLRISHATARVLERGHPWVLSDADTGDAGRFAPGTLVALRDPRGQGISLARTEAPSRARAADGNALVARVWQRGSVRRREAESVEARVERALEQRSDLISPPSGEPTTDAYRVVHGEADGLPGVAVDRLGDVLRVIESGRSAEAFRERMLDALTARLFSEPPAIVLVMHGRDALPGPVECVRLIGPEGAHWKGGRAVVLERGLRFLIETGLEAPERPTPGVGLYLDQRDNRERLAQRAQETGGRWLNLFAHTGAFSVALLAAGAEEVVSVDLSAHYLGWLEQNLSLNADAGVDPGRHRSVKSDGRRFLIGDAGRPPLDEGAPYAGIVLDPPTAAAAGRRFFSVAHDLAPLVEAALRRLAPGGVLLVSRNQRRGRGDLRALVEEAAARAGVRLAGMRDAAPGRDFPRLRGFPEGDSFRALEVRRR